MPSKRSAVLVAWFAKSGRIALWGALFVVAAVVGCAQTTNAPPPSPTVDAGPDLEVCVGSACACATTADCHEGVCDPADNRCVECLMDKDCPAGAVCSPMRTCMSGCTAEHGCADGGTCDTDGGLCVACVVDADCKNPSTPRCDPARLTCVPCLPAGLGNNGSMGNPPLDNCGPDTYCADHGGGSYGCQSGCKDDSDCAQDGGAGARCDVMGTHQCVACLGDDDCPLGKVCKANTCQDGCTLAHGCPQANNGNGPQACCNGACSDPTSDVNNCGGCNVACQGGWLCCQGACANPSNDGMNCGACGQDCTKVQNGTGGCSARMCGIVGCNPGWADCVGGLTDGCETNIASNVNNCGACNNACSLPHALPACVSGACQINTCLGTYADCDGSPQDGCEVDTSSDVNNCGGCNVVCPMGFDCVKGACSCVAQGACAPGQTRMTACGSCGMETDTCGPNCQWMAGACGGQGACAPGTTRMVACGQCGGETDTCSPQCQWVSGTCGAQGACAPGQTRTVSCGACGTEMDTCGNDCQWAAGSCTGQGACTPGQTRMVACGNCGVEVDTCGNDCQWAAGACVNQGVCAPNDTRTVACGNCGSEVDTCNAACQWAAGSCTGQGACAAGATRTLACGNCGTETDTCSNACQWVAGSCGGQGACAPGQTRQEGCGNCGVETDTCGNNCQWAAGGCAGQGPCAPGQTTGSGCDQCSQKVCGNNCQWGGCGLKPGNACEYQGGNHTRGCSCTWFSCGGSKLQWCLPSCVWSAQCDCCTGTCTRCE